VIDVHEKAAKNPDYTISTDDVRDWERRHGPIPEGAFVAMRTEGSSVVMLVQFGQVLGGSMLVQFLDRVLVLRLVA
jgi:hypothetical protein